MSNNFFRFKQFTIHQSDSAMKVGTDGVLLGAWHAIDGHPLRILDVGTGTGLSALMLAQRFNDAQVTGVEIDDIAAAEAQRNVAASPFAERIGIINAAFQNFRQQGVAALGGAGGVVEHQPRLVRDHGPGDGQAFQIAQG